MKAKFFIIFMLAACLIVAGAALTMAQESKAKEESKQEAQQEEVQKIDVNSATLDELQELKGIGPKLAQAIIDGRPYEVVEDLLEVKGIGEKKLAAIKDLVEVKPIKEEEKKQEQTTEEPQKKEGDKKTEKKS